MRLRIAITVLALAILILLSGCEPKVYFFSFKVEQDLENAQGEWIAENDDTDFNENGINIQEGNIACPFRFSGDLTMTVRFYLNATDPHEYYFGISLGDGTWYGSTENDLHVEVSQCGGPEERYYIFDHDQDGTEFWHYDESANVPGLDRAGLNIWVLTKVGRHITISVNDTEFADFILEEYNSRWFGPNLYSEWVDVKDFDYGFTVESIEVLYRGSASPMPVELP
jgi:hypothetical protein